MSQVRFVSRFLKWVFIVGVVFLPVVQAVFWAYADHEFFWQNAATVLPYDVSLPALAVSASKTKLLCFLISMIPTGISMAIFLFLIRLFSLYAKGVVFESANILLIRNIAYLLLVGAAIGPVYEALITIAYSMSNPAGQRMVCLSTQTINLTGIVTGLMILVVAWIMAEGHALQQEQELTV